MAVLRYSFKINVKDFIRLRSFANVSQMCLGFLCEKFLMKSLLPPRKVILPLSQPKCYI